MSRRGKCRGFFRLCLWIAFDIDSPKVYEYIRDVPRKLRQQLQVLYSNMICSDGASIEDLFDGVPVRVVDGIGEDGLFYALVVYYMNGLRMTVCAVKEMCFTDYELLNVVYFARDGLVGVVDGVGGEQFV